MEIPYFPFPENPELITIGKYKVYEYIKPMEMENYIKQLAELVNFNDYDHVFVNMEGGMFLFKELSKLKNYSKIPVLIEYHRPNNGFGANITTPVPDELKGTKGLVIDDIYDSGGVLRAILAELSPKSSAITLLTKKGIAGQIPIPGIKIGLSVDNVWIAGCGMDMGFDREKDTIRNYPGIVVKSN